MIATLFLVAAGGYAALLATLYFAQERLIFPASTLPAEHRFRFDQRFAKVTVPVAGATLHALRGFRWRTANGCERWCARRWNCCVSKGHNDIHSFPAYALPLAERLRRLGTPAD